MKKEARFYIALIALIAALLMLDRPFTYNPDEPATRVLPVAEFDSLKIEWPCTIYITNGDQNSVILEGDSRVIDRIEASLEDGVLRINRRGIDRLIGKLTGNTAFGKPVNIYIKLARKTAVTASEKAHVIRSLESMELEARQVSRMHRPRTFQYLGISFGRVLAQLLS